MKTLLRISVLLTLCAMLGISAASCAEGEVRPQAHPANLPNVAGTWAVEMKPPRGGTLNLTMQIEQAGPDLHGTWIPDNRPEIVNRFEGTVAEDGSLELMIEMEGSDEIINVSAFFQQGKIEGQFATQWEQPWPFAATREE